MENNILYRFIKLELTQFATFEDGYVDDENDIEISNSFQFAYSVRDNMVCCTTSVKISKQTGIVLKADLDSFFKLDAQSAENLKDGNTIVISPELMAQFASLSYGSMRGVIYAKTMGTSLSKIILPPNDVRGIFHSPLRLKENG